MTRSYVGLGANLGDALGALRTARRRLQGADGIHLVASSAIYRSAPLGPAGQADYLNAVIALDTPLVAEALLTRLQRLEAEAGRQRGERWGPRVLDLDLLLHGAEQRLTASLTLPHPGIYQRNFVLEPLAEICPPDFRFPDESSLGDRLRACPDNPIERTSLAWSEIDEGAA